MGLVAGAWVVPTAGLAQPATAWRERVERASQRVAQQRQQWQGRLEALHDKMIEKQEEQRRQASASAEAAARRQAFEADWQRLVSTNPRVKALADSFLAWRQARASRQADPVASASRHVGACWQALSADDRAAVETVAPGTGEHCRQIVASVASDTPKP